MEKYKYFIGIDVSKYKLDIYNTKTDEYITIKNKQEDIKEYIITLNQDNTLIIIDLTGGYEKTVAKIFYNNNFKNIILAEGLKVKNFSRTTKYHRAKTDKTDAKLLVEYGKQNYNKLELYKPQTDNRETITNIYKRIEDLKYILQQEKNRIKQPNIDEIIKENINSSIKTLKQQINQLETIILNEISKDEKLDLIYKTLLNQKGIATELALFILIKINNLGQIQRKQLTSICGLAPIPNDSGTINKHRYTQGGRREIKSKLFFHIVNLIRLKDETIYNKYKQLKSKGKPTKVIITALARKQLIILNAIVRQAINQNEKYNIL